ncbi:SURF1 family protein [Aeromicrobium sp. P5_D10]
MTRKTPLRSWFSPGLVGLHIFAVAAVLFCIVMGLWQAGAYDDRQHDEQTEKRVVPTVAFDGLWKPGSAFLKTFNHRPVTVVGEFAPTGDQFWVIDKSQGDRTGAWLMAPFMVRSSGDALLILRGWAAEPGELPPAPQGDRKIKAVLEPGEKAGTPFDAASRTIGSVRIPALLNEVSYDLYSGFAISTDASISGGLELVEPPQPDDVSWTEGLRNLAYALQWWVFGAFAAFMWWRMTVETARSTGRKVA